MVFVDMLDIFDDFEAAFILQSKCLCGQDVHLHAYTTTLAKAKERYLYCLSRKKIKHLPARILLHADEYTSFLYFLASQAWRDNCVELAELSYIVNRRLNGFDCFYTRELPEVFHLEHPIGTIIGQATFGNFLVVYQGVSIGGDMKLRYPVFGNGVALFAKSSVIGSAFVASNCAIGAGVQIYGDAIPQGTAVSLRSEHGLTMAPMSWSVQERFFKS